MRWVLGLENFRLSARATWGRQEGRNVVVHFFEYMQCTINNMFSLSNEIKEMFYFI